MNEEKIVSVKALTWDPRTDVEREIIQCLLDGYRIDSILPGPDPDGKPNAYTLNLSKEQSSS